MADGLVWETALCRVGQIVHQLALWTLGGQMMRAVRRLTVMLCLLLGTLSPAAAEERSARFVQLMRYLPDGMIANRSAQTPEFVDYEAARAIIDALVATGGGEVLPDAQRTRSGPFADAPQHSDWTPKVGFSRTDLRAGVLSNDPEARARIVLLRPEVMAQVGPALLANGYAQEEGKGFPAFWRIRDDLGFDRALRDEADPFTYPLPVSSRIALDGEILMQSNTWPMLEAMFATSETDPTVSTFGRVLDLPDWGDRRLVHATIFSDPMIFAPGMRIGKDMTPALSPPGGVPYWSNLMLVDLASAESDLTLVVLLYISRSDAEAAAASMAAGLGSLVLPSFGDKSITELTGPGRTLVTGDGPFAAVYAVETATRISTPSIVGNRGYGVLMNAAFSR